MSNQEICDETVRMLQFLVKWCDFNEQEKSFYWCIPYTDITLCAIPSYTGYDIVVVEKGVTNIKPVYIDTTLYPLISTNAPGVEGFDKFIEKFLFCKQFRYEELEGYIPYKAKE